jgi:toxin secretion/phage lysis holin
MPWRDPENWLRSKTFVALLLSLTFNPHIYFIETYLFSDWQFLKFLLILITIDTCLGVYLSWMHYEVSSYGFAKVFQKLVVYLVFLVLIHILCHFTVYGERNTLFTWLTSLGYGGILVREGISILEHLALINPNLLPQWLIKRLKDFDHTGNTE